jgi:predicted metal-dependent hydrolase
VAIHIDRIIRSKRKTLTLIVERDATLTVRAPRQLPDEEILRFVARRASWIDRKRQEVLTRQASVPRRRFLPGEEFLFLGVAYPLLYSERTDGARGGLIFDGHHFVLSPGERPTAREHFTTFYRERARLMVHNRLAHLSRAMGLEYERVRISNARRRWGSCSVAGRPGGATRIRSSRPRGRINISWRIVMAPPHVLDYVLVHELAHLKEMNHSKSFWRTVESVIPDYRERRGWLRMHADDLSW